MFRAATSGMLGVGAALGRVLHPSDDQTGAPPPRGGDELPQRLDLIGAVAFDHVNSNEALTSSQS